MQYAGSFFAGLDLLTCMDGMQRGLVLPAGVQTISHPYLHVDTSTPARIARCELWPGSMRGTGATFFRRGQAATVSDHFPALRLLRSINFKQAYRVGARMGSLLSAFHARDSRCLIPACVILHAPFLFKAHSFAKVEVHCFR